MKGQSQSIVVETMIGNKICDKQIRQEETRLIVGNENVSNELVWPNRSHEFLFCGDDEIWSQNYFLASSSEIVSRPHWVFAEAECGRE